MFLLSTGWWLTKKGFKFFWLCLSFGLWLGGCGYAKNGVSFLGFLMLIFFIFVLYKRVRRWWWTKAKAAIKRAEAKEKEGDAK